MQKSIQIGWPAGDPPFFPALLGDLFQHLCRATEFYSMPDRHQCCGRFFQSAGGPDRERLLFGYGICLLLSGSLGDRLNPRWMIFFGVVGSGLLNLAMGWMSNPNGMALIWTLNGMCSRLFGSR